MKKIKVENMVSPSSGREVANQLVIKVNECIYFQSYKTIIAKKCNGEVTLSTSWDYSRTTLKYLYQFLRDYCFFFNVRGKKDVEKLIKDGIIKVAEEL